jgi:hypothetical protein
MRPARLLSATSHARLSLRLRGAGVAVVVGSGPVPVPRKGPGVHVCRPLELLVPQVVRGVPDLLSHACSCQVSGGLPLRGPG